MSTELWGQGSVGFCDNTGYVVQPKEVFEVQQADCTSPLAIVILQLFWRVDTLTVGNVPVHVHLDVTRVQAYNNEC